MEVLEREKKYFSTRLSPLPSASNYCSLSLVGVVGLEPTRCRTYMQAGEMPKDGMPSSEKVHTVKAEGESERLPVNDGRGLRSTSEERDLQRKSHQRWLQ